MPPSIPAFGRQEHFADNALSWNMSKVKMRFQHLWYGHLRLSGVDPS
jgi:hypothetical protein